MSDIVFACEHCGQSLAIEDSARGMVIECPKCHKQLTISEALTECSPESLDNMAEPVSQSRDRKTGVSDDSSIRDNSVETLVTPKEDKPVVTDKRLFTFVRLIVVLISLGMIFSIIVAGIHLQKIRCLLVNHVSYRDIQQALHPTPAPAPVKKPKPVPEIQVSDTIRKYYPGRGSRELLEWLEKIDPEKRADFVANLTAVIKEAEVQKAPDMRAVIVEYQRQKRSTPDFRATNAYSARPTILALISFVAFLIGMLLAFCCLLLILLAAEKKIKPLQQPTKQ